MEKVPWIDNPYRLLSWFDMEQFAAEAFYELGRLLERIQETIGNLGEMEKDAPRFNDEERIAVRRTEIVNTLSVILAATEKACSKIGLRQPLKHIARLTFSIERGTFSAHGFQNALNELHVRISDEMEDHLFMHIPADRAMLYKQDELFGKDVNAKFPAVQFDIVEAGNCYAAGRGTAVVFHLMRIMETGVQAFGTKLGVPLADEKNWQNILDEVNKAIKALPSKDPNTVKMSQISSNLYAVKLAWRNEVMHPKDTYTLEEADNLIRQVKIFMQQLATIV